MLRLGCRCRGTRRPHAFFASRRRSPGLRLLYWTRQLAIFALRLPLMLPPLRVLLRPSLRARPDGAPASAAILWTLRWIRPLRVPVATLLALVLCPDQPPAPLDVCLPEPLACLRRTRLVRGLLGDRCLTKIPDAFLQANKVLELLFLILPALLALSRALM
jgi:hypothetical protein